MSTKYSKRSLQTCRALGMSPAFIQKMRGWDVRLGPIAVVMGHDRPSCAYLDAQGQPWVETSTRIYSVSWRGHLDDCSPSTTEGE
jgi:hypothetical protein